MTGADVLLGAGHNEILRRLQGRLRELQEGKDVKPVILIRGRSGIGKTRIIQQLYKEMQQGEPEPRYWPDLSTVDVLGARKMVAPKIDSRPPRSLPSFSWWGFNCSRFETGNAVTVVSEALPLMRTHLKSVGLAWGRVASAGDKWNRNKEAIFDKLQDAAKDEVMDILMDIFGNTLNLALPFAKTLVSWGWAGVKHAHTRSAQRDDRLHGIDSLKEEQDSRRRDGREFGEVIRGIAHKDLPAVIAVEDIHKMEEGLAALIETVAQRQEGKPILIVGTVWPEGSVADTPFTSWRKTNQALIEEISCPELGSGGLIELLRNVAPDTPDEVALAVVERLPMPLYLKLWLQTKAAGRQLRRNKETTHGKTTFLEGDLRSIPDVTGLVEEMWRELPENVQDALMYATAPFDMSGEPSSFLAGPGSDEIGHFVADLTAAIANTFDKANSVQEVRASLAQAADPAQWCFGTNGLQHFRDPLLASMSRQQSRKEYPTKEDEAELTEAARRRLKEWIDEHRQGIFLENDDVNASIAQWYVALGPHEASATKAAAEYLLGSVLGNTIQIDSVSHSQTGVNWLYEAALTALAVWRERPDELPLTDVASACRRANMVNDANELMQLDARQKEDRLERTHPDAIEARLERAFYLSEQKDSQGIDLLNEVVEYICSADLGEGLKAKARQYLALSDFSIGLDVNADDLRRGWINYRDNSPKGLANTRRQAQLQMMTGRPDAAVRLLLHSIYIWNGSCNNLLDVYDPVDEFNEYCIRQSELQVVALDAAVMPDGSRFLSFLDNNPVDERWEECFCILLLKHALELVGEMAPEEACAVLAQVAPIATAIFGAECSIVIRLAELYENISGGRLRAADE